MRRDPIERLLLEADEAAMRPEIPADLPGRVRRRVQRRRFERQVGFGAAALGVLVVALVLGRVHHFDPPADVIVKAPLPAETAPDSQSEIAELQTAIRALRVRALGELDQMSRGAQARAASLGLPEPTEVVDQQLEQAASLILYQADRLNTEIQLPAEAIRSYRSAIELFPDTRAARTARARLDEISASRGDRT